MTDPITGFLGIMRKASALAPGEDQATDAVMRGKARLLILASDIGERQEERAERMLEGHSAQKLKLPLTKAELGNAIGLGQCAMLAVTDLGFARALMEKLKERFPDQYDAEAEELEKRFQKIEHRKTAKPGSRFKKR